MVITVLGTLLCGMPVESLAQGRGGETAVERKTHRVKAPGSGLFRLRRTTTSQTLIHSAAPNIAATDQAREASREQSESLRRSEAIKQTSLITLQQETAQAVAQATARSRAHQPLPPRRLVASPSSGTETPELTTPLPPEPIKAHAETPTTPPRFAPAPLATTVTTPVENVDRFIDKLSDQVLGGSPEPPARSGFFALILVAMFVVPSTGVVLLFIGFNHLRHHSFVSGSVWVVVGGCILWSAVVAAQHVFPADEQSVGQSHATADPGTAVGARTALSEELWTAD